MELKVWVEGVVRVVCGLSMHTSCQDVVIALAQAIGQTGRYTLTLKLRGNERQLLATESPLQHLSQLGQLASEAQFFLQRTGSSLNEGPDKPGRNRRLPLPRTTEPESVKGAEPHKAFTFSLGSSSQEAKANRTSSPSPAASTVTFSDDLKTNATEEELFRQILQQRRRLRDLESQVQALERESWLWEQNMSAARVPSVSVGFSDQLEELEQQLRQNEEELIHSTHWEEQMQREMEREQDMQRQLHQIRTSIEDHSGQIMELQDRSGHLEHDIHRTVHRQRSQPSPWQQKESLLPLRQELLHRQSQSQELEAVLSEMQDELQVAERMKQDRWELIEELNKELRQCNLQQFIQQTGVSHTDQTHGLPMAEGYLSTAGVIE